MLIGWSQIASPFRNTISDWEPRPGRELGVAGGDLLFPFWAAVGGSAADRNIFTG